MLRFALLFLAATALFAAEPPLASPGWRFEELRRFAAPEAGQGVAVDRDHFYAINNRTVAKYRKTTGERVALWEDGAGGPLIHLNAGLVHRGRLWCAHSNYPGVPMLSSLEVFDPDSLRPIATHSFGRADGSFTWLDRRERSATLRTGGAWVACFVHYGKRGGEPGRGPEWTQLVEFDEDWRRLRAWSLPPALVAHLGDRGYSVSGGGFGPRGLLYLTGHDNKELYVADFPAAGSVLKWLATVPIPAEGQAFAWDHTEPGMLYCVLKRTREVIVGRVTSPAP